RCFVWEKGDRAKTDKAFAGAPHVTTLDLVNNRVVVNAMEPRGALGEFDPGLRRFTLHSGNQGAHDMRAAMAGVLGVPINGVRVVCPDVGGGFGMKGMVYPEQALVLWLARKVGRPVKWISERSEGFLSDTQGRDNVTRIELATDRDGKFLALRTRTLAAMGAYLSTYAPAIPTMS